MARMWKCKHVRQQGIIRRGRRISIQGWYAIVCDDCYTVLSEALADLEQIFEKHKTTEGEE